jgi:hypothetical protein
LAHSQKTLHREPPHLLARRQTGPTAAPASVTQFTSSRWSINNAPGLPGGVAGGNSFASCRVSVRRAGR